jgi:transcriptional regulator with XRE-family HTH domain
MITIEQIQKNLAEAIRESGKTQTEIAKALNVSQQTISCYKNKKSYQRWTLLQTYASALILTPPKS